MKTFIKTKPQVLKKNEIKKNWKNNNFLSNLKYLVLHILNNVDIILD